MESTKSPDFNTSHPELGPGESFIANIREADLAHWQNAASKQGQVIRLGSKAYAPQGTLLTGIGIGMKQFRPLFLTGKRCKGEPSKELHPECLSTEICIGNFTCEEFAAISFQTKRKGLNAYDADGMRITEESSEDPLFPVFVQTAEYFVKRT